MKYTEEQKRRYVEALKAGCAVMVGKVVAALDRGEQVEWNIQRGIEDKTGIGDAWETYAPVESYRYVIEINWNDPRRIDE